jgi:transposase
LFFLPGYAPELNPDEWVWKHVKHDRIGRAGVTGPKDLKAALRHEAWGGVVLTAR